MHTKLTFYELQEYLFTHGKGHFSSEGEERFEKHLKALREAVNRVPNKTLEDIRKILWSRNLWYGSPTL